MVHIVVAVARTLQFAIRNSQFDILLTSDTVIRVENLGKKYIIGHQANGYRTLRDVLADSLAAPLGFAIRTSQFSGFWATLSVNEYEVNKC